MFSELQEQVLNLAKSKIQNEPWFCGVCVNEIPSDPDIEKMGVNEAANLIVFDTAMHDAPFGEFWLT